MNCLFIYVLVAMAVAASAISPLANINLASIFGDKFKVHAERFPPAPVAMKEVSDPVTKGKYYRTTTAPLGATNNQYFQMVAFGNPDCTGDVSWGGAYLLNYCWLYGYGNPAMMMDPFYVHFSVPSNNTLSLNVHNTTDCSGMTLYRANNIATEGCSTMGHMGVRAEQVMTPLWPQGQGGFSIKSHHNAKSCNTDGGFAYNFNTEFYMKLNSCMNTTTSTAMSSYSVSACSSSASNFQGSYTMNMYTNGMCSGTPSTSMIASNAECNTGTFSGEDQGQYGYDSYGCFDQAMHNKCYENFGIASPACDAQLTKHALKFTCSDPGYTGCESRIITNNHKKNSEVFSCCV